MHPAARDLWLRGPDLLRFQRLYRHGNRAGPAVASKIAEEFPPTVYGGLSHRILAALAHNLVVLAARLSLYPARRQSWLNGLAHEEYHCHDGSRRVVAWRKLDLCRLGSLSRLRHCADASLPSLRAARVRLGVAVVAEGRPDFPRRHDRMDILPGAKCAGCLAGHVRDFHRSLG